MLIHCLKIELLKEQDMFFEKLEDSMMHSSYFHYHVKEGSVLMMSGLKEKN